MTNRLLTILFLFLPCISYSQCDLELLDVDFVQGTYTIAFNNTNGCGGTGGPDGVSEIQIAFQAIDPDSDCSAMNQGWTFPSDITIPDDSNHPGWIYTSTSTESSTNWTNLWDDWPWDVDPPYYTGDTITFPFYNPYQQDCSPGAFWYNNLTCQLQDALQFWIDEELSIQAVIWQISYGPTMYAADGGWAEIGPLGNGTNTGVGIYDDDNFLDNWLVFGPCGEPFPEVIIDTIYVELPCDTTYIELPPDTITIIDTLYVELPPDTIIIIETDTLYITEYDTIIQIDTLPVPINWYFYDTTYIYVELPPDTVIVTDTLTIIEILFDTIYVELPPDTVNIVETEYIYETDTMYEVEYIYQIDTLYETIIDTIIEYTFIEIDCATGLPCSDLGFDECDPLTVYIPNTFTPNNDGVNDAWEVILDPNCWTDITLQVYSRWGNLVFESYDPYYLIWDGGNNGGGYYVPDGTYYWTFSGRKINSTIVEELGGHVTIFR